MAWRRRQHLIFLGYSEAEILRLGDLGKLTNERMNQLIRSKNLPTIEKTGEERNMEAADLPVLGPGLIDGQKRGNVSKSDGRSSIQNQH
jgi:hypothetical protein